MRSLRSKEITRRAGEILGERSYRGAGYGLEISLERELIEEQVMVLRSLQGELT